MRYRTIDGGYKVPMFTKSWKLRKVAVGMVFGILAPCFVPLYYNLTCPNIKTVRKVAMKYTWLGIVLHLVLLCLLHQIGVI